MKRVIGAVVAVGFAFVMAADVGDAEHRTWVAVTSMSEDTYRLVLVAAGVVMAVLVLVWDRLPTGAPRVPPTIIKGGDGGAGGGASAGPGGMAIGGQGGGGGGVGPGAQGGAGGESGYAEFRRRFPELVNPALDDMLLQAGRGGRGGDAPVDPTEGADHPAGT